MIWATVSSQSCFSWPYRASPSSAAKNIISLISVLTIWWCPCVESSLVLLWPLYSLGKTLLAFALVHSAFQDQICLLLQCFLTSYFCIQVPYNEKGIFLWVLVLKDLVGLHRTIQLSFFSITGWGIGLDYCDIEWFALEMNRDHSVIFEVASKYCISDSFVGRDGYSVILTYFNIF